MDELKNSININISKIYTIYFSHETNWDRPFYAKRDSHAIVLFTGGEIEYTIGEKIIHAKKGEILKLTKTIPYSGKKVSNSPNSFIIVNFDTIEEDEFEKFPIPTLIKNVNYSYYKNQFSSLLRTYNKNELYSVLKCKSLLYNLLNNLLTNEIEKSNKQLSSIIEYIQDNYTNPHLTMSELCDLFFISESQLRRNIRKATGVSPSQYITDLRIKKAKNMLMYENKSITEISYLCGYNSTFYFSRIFKKTTGFSPTDFKNKFLL